MHCTSSTCRLTCVSKSLGVAQTAGPFTGVPHQRDRKFGDSATPNKDREVPNRSPCLTGLPHPALPANTLSLPALVQGPAHKNMTYVCVLCILELPSPTTTPLILLATCCPELIPNAAAHVIGGPLPRCLVPSAGHWLGGDLPNVFFSIDPTLCRYGIPVLVTLQILYCTLH
jgi:hypothetical protein